MGDHLGQLGQVLRSKDVTKLLMRLRGCKTNHDIWLKLSLSDPFLFSSLNISIETKYCRDRSKCAFKKELDKYISTRKAMVQIQLSFWNPLNTYLLEEGRYFKGKITP